MKPGILCVALLTTVALSGAPPDCGQTLQVFPNPAMADEPVAIRASGLQPGDRVSLHAELVDGVNARWVSEAEFVADAQGSVDTAAQSPAAGSYREVSGPGMIWSMMPTDKHVQRYEAPADLSVQNIEFDLVRGGRQIASAQLQQRRLAEGVRQVKLVGKLQGTLFVPAAGGPHPGVLVLGGFEGGVPMNEAAWLASHGYAALALAYFHYEDLPPALKEIPLEYFGSAIEWMMNRPEILPNRIAAVGISRGAELALQLGSTYDELKAIVAFAPANVRGSAGLWYYGASMPLAGAWTWHGRALAFLPGGFIWNPSADPHPTDDVVAAIDVEQAHGPLFLICGDADGVWPSSTMVATMTDRLRRARFPYRASVLRYGKAGHQAGQPQIIPAWQGTLTSPATGFTAKFGGTVQGNADSTLDAIPKILDFLRVSLGQDPSAHR